MTCIASLHDVFHRLADGIDDKLFSVTACVPKPSLETAGAMSPALQASLLARIDLDLLKLSQWPRLLASRIEQHSLSTLGEAGLEAFMLDALRSEKSVLGMAVAFEPVRVRVCMRAQANEFAWR